MRFTVFHVQNEPININDRADKLAEWRTFYAEFKTRIPPADADPEAHQTAWKEATDFEAVLEAKYPSKAIWNIRSLSEFKDLIKKYGSITMCKEADQYTLYLYPTVEEMPSPSKIEDPSNE